MFHGPCRALRGGLFPSLLIPTQYGLAQESSHVKYRRSASVFSRQRLPSGFRVLLLARLQQEVLSIADGLVRGQLVTLYLVFGEVTSLNATSQCLIGDEYLQEACNGGFPGWNKDLLRFRATFRDTLDPEISSKMSPEPAQKRVPKPPPKWIRNES